MFFNCDGKVLESFVWRIDIIRYIFKGIVLVFRWRIFEGG